MSSAAFTSVFVTLRVAEFELCAHVTKSKDGSATVLTAVADFELSHN
jgi:hypothetical protein